MEVFFQQFKILNRQIFSGLKCLPRVRLSLIRKVFSLMGRREKIITIIFGLLLILGIAINFHRLYISKTSAAPDNGGSFSEAMRGQPNFINPVLAFQEPDLSLVKLIFSGLYKYDSQGRLTPDLAEGMPEISEDQKQYLVNLKQNITWHDGRRFNADDVLFTIQSIKDPSLKSPQFNQWQSVTVEKLSEWQVRFTTKEISAPFLSSLTLPILPEYVWMKIPAQAFNISEYNLEAVGTGPFAVESIEKMPNGKVRSLRLKAFKDYKPQRPKLDNIVVKFYDTDEDAFLALTDKEVDAFGYNTSQTNTFHENPGQSWQMLQAPIPSYQTLFFNIRGSILGEGPVRKALTMSIDRQAVSQAGFAGNNYFPNKMLVYNFGQVVPYQDIYNLEEAKNLLEQAGWKVDPETGIRTKKNSPLRLTLYSNDTPSNNRAAQKLAETWKSLQIDIKVEILPSKELADEHIKPRNFDILLFPLKFSADPDPFVFWHSSQQNDPGLNLSGFSSDLADKLLTEARTTTNQSDRPHKYSDLNTILEDQSPVFLLNQSKYVYFIAQKIKGVSLGYLFDSSGKYTNITGWYMEEKRVWK